MGFKHPVAAKPAQLLVAQSDPNAPNQPEAVPWIFYDTQAYVDNTTLTLNFFQVTNVDRSITNMVTAGQLPHPQFFEWYYVGLDVLRAPTTAAGGVVGAIDDIQRLMLTSRPFWTFTMSDKILGPFPLSFMHASGGATGFGWGTFTAEESIQYGNNAIFDGGWCLAGAITIPPKVGFGITLNWPAVVDLTADVNLRLWMAGTLHRRVL